MQTAASAEAAKNALLVRATTIGVVVKACKGWPTLVEQRYRATGEGGQNPGISSGSNYLTHHRPRGERSGTTVNCAGAGSGAREHGGRGVVLCAPLDRRLGPVLP